MWYSVYSQFHVSRAPDGEVTTPVKTPALRWRAGTRLSPCTPAKQQQQGSRRNEVPHLAAQQPLYVPIILIFTQRERRGGIWRKGGEDRDWVEKDGEQGGGREQGGKLESGELREEVCVSEERTSTQVWKSEKSIKHRASRSDRLSGKPCSGNRGCGGRHQNQCRGHGSRRRSQLILQHGVTSHAAVQHVH